MREMEDKLTTVKTRKQQELIEIGTDNILVSILFGKEKHADTQLFRQEI